MNKTRRVFSLLMAVVLVLSVFGVTASAAVASGKRFALVAECSDTPTAGGTINVKYYFEVPADIDIDTFRFGQFKFYISYDNSLLTPVSNTWNSAIGEFGQDALFSSNNTISKISSKLTEAEKTKYPAALTISMNYDTQSGADSTTGWALLSSKTLAFTVKFKVADTYKGQDINFGVLDNSFLVTAQCYVKAVTDKSTASLVKSSKYLTTAIDNQTMLTLKGASYKVSDSGVQIRRNLDDASKYDLRFIGSFKTADIEALFAENSNTSTNITSVGCEVTMNGVTNTYTDGYIYPTTDGYKFAAIMPGLTDAMADMEITVKMFVVVDGVKECSKGVTTKLSAHTDRLPA